ncbi:MAG: hypothetical protein KKH94_03595 [Candidatus Omnitrophica bacterium]|nr:hypothetical protein [Candidatus Omnitrophota bacterium]
MKKPSTGNTTSIVSTIFFTCSLFLLPGCAGLSFKRVSVDFENPYARLEIVQAEPTKEEIAGVVLRIFAPHQGHHTYGEEMIMFAQIAGDEGIRLHVKKHRKDTYHTVRKNAFIVQSETKFEHSTEKLVSELELNSRGGIVRFINGSHHSKMVRLTIKNWKRTPMFPEGQVKIGDCWNWEEVMDVRLKLFLIKEKKPTPYIIRAKSTLAGFAWVGGIRCAVIKTIAVEQKRQHLKFLFKNIDLNINTQIEEQTYLDYATGTVVVQIVTTLNRTESSDALLSDISRSQSIVYLSSADL